MILVMVVEGGGLRRGRPLLSIAKHWSELWGFGAMPCDAVRRGLRASLHSLLIAGRKGGGGDLNPCTGSAGLAGWRAGGWCSVFALLFVTSRSLTDMVVWHSLWRRTISGVRVIRYCTVLDGTVEDNV